MGPQTVPTLSVGLAVRNGVGVAERCIESVLSQDYADLELVICDNASEDGTGAMLQAYARSDARVRVFSNPANIGIHENMKLVVERSRGTYFRWISSDDWLEPRCLSTCVRALETRSDAVGVTTWFTMHGVDGSTRYEEYDQGYPESLDPVERFRRMLWFFHAGDTKYDPVYGVFRREHLLTCRPLRPSERTDWLLSAELALKGPIIHVRERLAHRMSHHPTGVDRAAFRRRLDPAKGEQIRTSPRRLHRQMLAMAVSADLTDAQLRRCKPALRRFWYKETVRIVRQALSDALHRALRRRARTGGLSLSGRTYP